MSLDSAAASRVSYMVARSNTPLLYVLCGFVREELLGGAPFRSPGGRRYRDALLGVALGWEVGGREGVEGPAEATPYKFAVSLL